MTTYTMMDVLMASPDAPLPIQKRMYQLEVMWNAMDSLEKADKPSLADWDAVAGGINMMEALRDLGVVEDPDHLIEDAIAAMVKTGYRYKAGANMRLDGPAITLLRGLLEDYCNALNELPARTVISAHRHAERRIVQMRKGKLQPTDVVVK